MQIEWFDLLTRRGVYVSTSRTRPINEKLIDFIYKRNHIQAGGFISNSTEDENEAKKGVEGREVSQNNVPSHEDAEKIKEEDQTRRQIFRPLDTNYNRQYDGDRGW